jgi:hypothetical protein
MPKWTLYALLAVVDLVAAWYFFSNGRVVLPAILTFAALCFVFATLGELRKKGGPANG